MTMVWVPGFKLFNFSILCLIIGLLCACNEPSDKRKVSLENSKPIVAPAKISSVQEQIRSYLNSDNSVETGLVASNLEMSSVLVSTYSARAYRPIWTESDSLNPLAHRFISFIDSSANFGLFPSDYHYKDLLDCQRQIAMDTLKPKHTMLLAKIDLLLSNAFFNIIQDLKQGRLVPDSVKLKSAPKRNADFFGGTLQQFIKGIPIDTLVKSIEPAMKGYHDLKMQIRDFVAKMDTSTYTYLKYPFEAGNSQDSIDFIEKLSIRLKESGIGNGKMPEDTLQLFEWVLKYQSKHGLVADGKVGPSVVKKLNASDKELFLRISITLDRYKLMPSDMPEQYILVNLPAYKLQVWDADTVVFQSKIICGKPTTATPFITSAISNMVIFPTWTVPASIIKKEILPGLKKNAGYLGRKGLNLYTYTGEKVDPGSVNWDKYSKGIPFKVQQGSGIDNALGVIKFNFDNPFDVYLHDTNQRYLFKKSMRALSHGCVRVQEWEKLAFFLARNDSTKLAISDSLRYTTDSISTWIAQKQKQRIQVMNRMPLYIRYFSCEGIEGKLIVHDDIYQEDKKLREKYFNGFKVARY